MSFDLLHVSKFHFTTVFDFRGEEVLNLYEHFLWRNNPTEVDALQKWVFTSEVAFKSKSGHLRDYLRDWIFEQTSEHVVVVYAFISKAVFSTMGDHIRHEHRENGMGVVNVQQERNTIREFFLFVDFLCTDKRNRTDVLVIETKSLERMLTPQRISLGINIHSEQIPRCCNFYKEIGKIVVARKTNIFVLKIESVSIKHNLLVYTINALDVIVVVFVRVKD